MRCSSRAALLGALVVLAGGISPGRAEADTWPVSRHDAARTGASAGNVPVVEPVVTWRAYMGGRPTGRVARFGLDHVSRFVVAVGGRFVAKHGVSGATLWKSDILGVGAVEAFADLDGDGRNEVVVRTETRTHVLDGLTGKLLWSSPLGEFRAPASVRVTDLDGDGLSDVYIDECTACATPGTMTAGAFSFAAGFGAGSALWMRPANASPPPSHTGTDTILDLDDDGLPEIVLTSPSEIVIVSGKDGQTVTTVGLPGIEDKPFSQAYALAAEIDGLPGKELIVVQPHGQVAAKVGPPGITVFKLDPQTKAGTLLFQRKSAGYEAEMVALADVAKDLDGDGIDELVFSHRATAASPFTTEILKGAAGTTVAVLPGARFEGAADLDTTAGAELVTATAAGLSVHHFDGNALTSLAGPIPGVRAHSMPDLERWQRGPLDHRLAVLPRPGQTSVLLVGRPKSDLPYAAQEKPQTFRDIQGFALGASGATKIGEHVPLVGDVTGVFGADFSTRPYPQVAVGTTAGTIVVLGQALQGTNGIVFWGGKATGSLVGGGMQPSGGAVGGPLVGSDDLGPFVVLPGSPLGLYVGDARFASLIVPPLPRFIQPGMQAASIVDLDSLGMAVVGVEGSALVARRSQDGTSLGAVDLGPGAPHGTPLPLRVQGQSVPRVGLDWRIEGVQIVQSAVDFASKSLVWQGAPLPFGGFFGSGVGDLDGDGTDAWYSMNDGLNARDAATGVVTTTPGNYMWYSLPMLASFQGGPGPELLLQAGASSPRLLHADLGTAWQAESPEQVNGMAGARVVCDNAPRFVTPAVLSPTLRAFDGATGALLGARTLAGGSAFPTVDAAIAAGKRPGVLSNVTSVASLGPGGPAILTGSTDGHLYALDACTLDLRWSKFLGGSVAEPVVGDTDGDGADEIMVGVADGYIHHIDVPGCLTPGFISFGATDDGPPDDAPHVVKPGEAVTVAFAPVAEAKSYEYALVGPDDQALWSPAYKTAAGTEIPLDLEGVLADRPYRVAVRAIGPNGASPDVFSRPVVVEDGNDPTLEVAATADGTTLHVALDASDDLALDHWLVKMIEPAVDSAEEIFAGEGLFEGRAGKAELAITPPSTLFGKKVTVFVSVLDSGGNEALTAINASVDDKGHFTQVDPPVILDPDQPIETPTPEPTTFGGCGASGRTPGASALVVALGLGLGGLFRRARRASTKRR
ncbi:VCBS repeat-containing protein [Polyangium jinanense]|uniref:FG-GAP repeat domain-containing protein n=1 Tax=Polyangium jinanense TaxID=2829994 RepID=UPI002341FDDB|nr:VCBS repeat-containing protein [Polyangium jinanense]MDC3955861.1 VCBS repeat-containing protein [Polyangium jinanense]